MSQMNENKREELLRTAFDWHERLSLDSATDADREALQAWLAEDYRHEDAFERAGAYSAAFDHLAPEDLSPDFARPLLVERVSLFIDAASNLFTRPATRWAVAGLALAAIALPTLMTGTQEAVIAPEPVELAYATSLGDQRTVSLPDGSLVTLDAKTKMTVTLFENVRQVTLENGTALFDVAEDQDRPFIVLAEDLTVTVKGTVFDVRNNGGVQRVGVSEGEVEASYPFVIDGQASSIKTRQSLIAGQQVMASADAGLSTLSAIDPERVGLWQNAILFYDGATLSEMVADANRYSERPIVLEIELDSEMESTVSGSFRTDDIPNMLSIMALSYGVIVDDEDPNRIVIRQAN